MSPYHLTPIGGLATMNNNEVLALIKSVSESGDKAYWLLGIYILISIFTNVFTIIIFILHERRSLFKNINSCICSLLTEFNGFLNHLIGIEDFSIKCDYFISIMRSPEWHYFDSNSDKIENEIMIVLREIRVLYSLQNTDTQIPSETSVRLRAAYNTERRENIEENMKKIQQKITEKHRILQSTFLYRFLLIE